MNKDYTPNLYLDYNGVIIFFSEKGVIKQVVYILK